MNDRLARLGRAPLLAAHPARPAPPRRPTPARHASTASTVAPPAPAPARSSPSTTPAATTRGSTFWALDATARWQPGHAGHDGRIGYGGLVRRHQRRSRAPAPRRWAPTGCSRRSARHAASAGWDLPLPQDPRAATTGCRTTRRRYYNRYRNKRQGGFRWWLPASDPNSSERLHRLPDAVRVLRSSPASTTRQVRHRGAGIFLHVNGRGATAGCVSAPRWFIAVADVPARPGPRRRVIAIGR